MNIWENKNIYIIKGFVQFSTNFNIHYITVNNIYNLIPINIQQFPEYMTENTPINVKAKIIGTYNPYLTTNTRYVWGSLVELLKDHTCHDLDIENYEKSSCYSESDSESTGKSYHSESTGKSCYSESTNKSCHSESTNKSYHSESTNKSCHSESTNKSYHSESTGKSCYSESTNKSYHSESTGKSCHSESTNKSYHSESTGKSCHSESTGKSCHSESTGTQESKPTCFDVNSLMNCNYKNIKNKICNIINII